MKAKARAAIAATMALLLGQAVRAQEWTGDLRLVKVEPLISWNGGAVRIVVDTPFTSTACGSGVVADLLLSGTGTQEARSAAVAALYMALAANKLVRLYIATGACGPTSSPSLLGLDVVAN